MPAETATIEFHYGSKYRQTVIEEQYPGDWIEVTITVGSTYIYGCQNQGITGLASGIVLQLLESIDAVLSDEQYILEFEYGPTWMVVEPWNEDTINVSRATTMEGARNPDERLDIDTSRPITKQGWIKAVIDTAQEFHDTIIDMNPSLRDQEEMVEIQNEIHRVEEEWETSDKAGH
ncbi:hypothetical protein MUK72_06945 [Halococcus dombrowskii]|uniref:Uncharacterized protein n=1 Tax=Halococcus dombrowskii TaxID=179637 RepID=A0AAX3AQK9_HALDO|nr:hypothetical protein [Halococcus dombrowskii]UOO96434.1 hypothetical protein MUK72_06945 [Halococcus dombrowskii]